MRVADLPVVLLSYDEPWADATAAELRSLVPGLIRVHGVKGLDACHKAAAQAAGGDFFVTVDADTTVHPSFLTATIPDSLVSDHVRLCWHSRNAVNGLPSGNGSLKVWPRALVMAMQTHEAAPADRISIDHDLGDVLPGVTRTVVLPGIHATTDPARTPEHAFRAGFREAVYLDHVITDLSRRFGPDNHRIATLDAILAAWTNLGRHVRNGLWAIHGARLGLWLARTQPGRDPRMVNDYAAMRAMWLDWILPRFSPGGSSCRWTGETWDQALLEKETRALGQRLAGLSGVPVGEVGAEQSELVARLRMLPAHRNGDAADGLGWALVRGKGVRRDAATARAEFEVATALGHAAAPLNLGRMMEKGEIEGADPAEIRRLFRMADALGNPNAAALLDRLEGAARAHDLAQA
jgi:hypothetical protein